MLPANFTRFHRKKQLFGKLRIKDGQRVCRVERRAEGERFLVDVEIAAVVGDAGVRLFGVCRAEVGVSALRLQQSGKFIPWQVVTISTDGRILD